VSASLTPSQTVGPFFGVGLPFEGSEQAVPPATEGAIRIEGQVFDGEDAPVPDALIEIVQPDGKRFARCRTDPEGAFNFTTIKPAASRMPDGSVQAPHLNVTVFARGLLRHLLTRMYFPDETLANVSDPVLNLVDPGRRSTLIAEDDENVLRFDIRLQGEHETVFFAI
jgi:protocatechuate 3,4-dioxygenase alpha subunit